KDILYVWPYLDTAAIEIIQPQSLANKDSLHEISILIGDLLDIGIRMQLLQDKAYLIAIGPEAKSFLQTASENWQSRKTQLSQKIQKMLAPSPQANRRQTTRI
ncbi:MAG: hypothetical protein JST68_28730, partial [Bacteroidetes bacterium]|nr:hypothetical protein [Bacteroidota bacterium]